MMSAVKNVIVTVVVLSCLLFNYLDRQSYLEEISISRNLYIKSLSNISESMKKMDTRLERIEIIINKK